MRPLAEDVRAKAQACAERTRAAQGLPRFIEDPLVVDVLAAALDDDAAELREAS